MLRSKILPAAMVATIALGTAGVAHARSHERGLERLGQEITVALDAKVSAVQAIAAAEQKTGGRALKIGLERKNGAYLYEIRTVSNGKVAKAFVDPASGKIVKIDDQGSIARFFESDEGDDSAKLADSSTTLAAAIATAEQQVGGTAIEAKFRQHDRNALFVVQVAKDRIVYNVAVDPVTGKVVSGEAADRHEHENDDDGEHHD